MEETTYSDQERNLRKVRNKGIIILGLLFGSAIGVGYLNRALVRSNLEEKTDAFFMKYDKNTDGMIDRSEYLQALRKKY